MIRTLQFIILLCSTLSFTQTLNPTVFIRDAGTADSFKGGYTFAYATSGTPWNGSLLSFGGHDNHYDTQISASYYSQNISFRTRNGDFNNNVGKWNEWQELATKGSNNFVGNQLINGKVGINVSNPSFYLNLFIPPSGNKIEGFTIDVGSFGTINNMNQSTYFQVRDVGGNGKAEFIIKGNGNVGIGEDNPQNKLDVNGTVHVKEVKVDMSGWADYVFAKDYKLPTLEEVEKHISDKGHLFNIPSAKEVTDKGVNLGEINVKLLEKIEELTLYLIEQNKQLKLQQDKIEKLEINIRNTKK